MSVVSFQAIPGQLAANVTSPYGGVPWSPTGPNIVANSLNPGQGTLWGVFRIQTPMPSGEVFNGMIIQGGNDFTVGGGGVSITRQAVLYGNILHQVSDFNGVAGTVMDTLVGTGAGETLNFLFQKSGFTSTDINNGSLFFGVAVKTSTENAGMGTFRFGALNLTLYTGSDTPFPPPQAPSGTLTNPKQNYDPGKVPGTEKFASVSFRLDTPINLQGVSHIWDLKGVRNGLPPPGLTFADGNQQLIIGGLFSGSTSVTGLINIRADVPVETYGINARASAAGINFSLSSQLIVRQGGSPIMFTEA